MLGSITGAGAGVVAAAGESGVYFALCERRWSNAYTKAGGGGQCVNNTTKKILESLPAAPRLDTSTASFHEHTYAESC